VSRRRETEDREGPHVEPRKHTPLMSAPVTSYRDQPFVRLEVESLCEDRRVAVNAAGSFTRGLPRARARGVRTWWRRVDGIGRTKTVGRTTDERIWMHAEGFGV